MWNFGLPYKLKQLIDLVAQRNYLFSYDGKQYGPLLNVEKAVAVYTRGSRYLEAGIRDSSSLASQPGCPSGAGVESPESPLFTTR
jgi:FMN-dependent NADH-azoreductase